MSTPVTPALLTTLLGLAGQLDAERVLAQLVVDAAEHTGATYAALGELDAYGETTTFVQQGMPAETEQALGHPPRGTGVLGALPDEGVLLLDDLTTHPAFGGFPPGHPMMRTFLGVPVVAGSTLLGRLYLTEKAGGFTREDVETVQLLAAAAAVAINNAHLYRQSQVRERWLAVSQEITTQLLEGSDEEDVLQLVAHRIREVADADGAAIVLPSLDDAWVVEIVDGPGTQRLIGAVLPAGGPAAQTVASGTGLLIDSISREAHRFAEPARIFERALYAPLLAGAAESEESAAVGGVLILFRLPGRVPFTEADLAVAHDFGAQAALALKLAAARHAEDVSSLLTERNRIARDLHDLAIQQLFATGMRLEHAKGLLAGSPRQEELRGELEDAIDGVDEGVRQIRGIVRSLRDRDEQLPVLERLVRETSLARASLGFAPSVLLRLDGVLLEAVDPAGEESVELDARLGVRLGDDVVAVVREGLSNVARHAQATGARVEIEVAARTVRVAVVDDGRGPDPASHRRSGLANLTGRAEDHAGNAKLSPGPDGGSVLVWEAWIG
ncbi:histidine kinase [Serinibacter arcticus]|uniref:Histidine kinase n=1 Tax=Serinibacter arcticus TaxID=1655435 RepID=A0A2U1ZQY6_9MICO|nr:GAF domain-containing protein [Serinibacter arcticus]PWD49415.1 histidine kinase [Serinibacter arcticus]